MDRRSHRREVRLCCPIQRSPKLIDALIAESSKAAVVETMCVRASLLVRAERTKQSVEKLKPQKQFRMAPAVYMFGVDACRHRLCGGRMQRLRAYARRDSLSVRQRPRCGVHDAVTVVPPLVRRRRGTGGCAAGCSTRCARAACIASRQRESVTT